MFGVWAFSSGVSPPSDSTGRSDIPSPCMMTYFTRSQPHGRKYCIDIGGDAGRLFGTSYRGIGVLETVAG